MKNKIINFFYRHRIVDSHIGLWDLHIWLYFLATYFDMHIIKISIYIRGFYIFLFDLELNKSNPRLFSFEFKIFNLGFDTDKGYHKKVSEDIDKWLTGKKEEKNKFLDSLNEKEVKLIGKYDLLR